MIPIVVDVVVVTIIVTEIIIELLGGATVVRSDAADGGGGGGHRHHVIMDARCLLVHLSGNLNDFESRGAGEEEQKAEFSVDADAVGQVPSNRIKKDGGEGGKRMRSCCGVTVCDTRGGGGSGASELKRGVTLHNTLNKVI